MTLSARRLAFQGLVSLTVAAGGRLFGNCKRPSHYDFGFSREEIRALALAGAIVIGALMAVEYFGKKLQKFK